MKTAIQIIRDAYSYAGITPNGVPLNAEKSSEGLGFLNELLYMWNAKNYFPFTHNTIDGHVSGQTAKIAPEDAEFIGEKPISINKVMYRDASTWYAVNRVSYEKIYELSTQATLPSYFAFTNDDECNGELVFDCENGNFDARIIYNKALPTMDFADELNAPPQYEQLLKYGIAVKCGIRYGLPADVVSRIKGEQDAILSAIEKANSYKHSLTLKPMKAFAYDDMAVRCLTGRSL